MAKAPTKSEPPSSTRRRRAPRISGDDRERAILATAEKLLGERSFHDLSVDDLAAGAGISRSTFYFYFPSKEAVLLTLLDRVADEARTAGRSSAQPLGDPLMAWRAGLGALFATFRSHRPVMLAAMEQSSTNDEVRTLWAGVMRGFVDETQAWIEQAQAHGFAPRDPSAHQMAIALNAMNERVFQTMLAGEAELDEDEVLDVLVTIWTRAVYGRDLAWPVARRARGRRTASVPTEQP